jgi:hypothetical protein
VAGEREGRAVAVFKPQHIDEKIARRGKIAGSYRAMIQSGKRHDSLPLVPARLCVLSSFVLSCLPGPIITLTNRVVMGQMIIVR